MAGKANLKLNQGETYRHNVYWAGSNEVAINITGFVARMHIRSKVDAATTLFELTTENGGIIISNPVAGELKLYISAADTASFTWYSGVYDLEIVAPNGDVVRLLEGQVTVSREVTR